MRIQTTDNGTPVAKSYEKAFTITVNDISEYGNPTVTPRPLPAPEPDGILAPTATISWTPVQGAYWYRLLVGTAVGGSDIYNGAETYETSAEVYGVPVGQGSVYVSIKTTDVGGEHSFDCEYLKCAACPPAQTGDNVYVPNYVQTTSKIYTDLNPAVNSTIISRAYTDGFGRGLESQTTLNDQDGNPEKKIISGVNYDDFGRVNKTFLPYVEDTDLNILSFVPLSQLPDKVKTYYQSYYPTEPDPIAYSEAQYWEDPLNRVKYSGAPGVEYSIPGNHTPRAWSFGTNAESGNAKLTPSGFINFSSSVSPQITIQDLDTWFENGTIPDVIDPNLYLAVTMDANGIISQSITDLFGNTLKTSEPVNINVSPRPSSIGVLASNTYDITGRVLEEQSSLVSPNPLDPSRYTYNTLGQLLKKETPDGGTVYYKYNYAGQLRFVQNSIQSFIWEHHGELSKPMYLYEYDNLGRQVITSILDIVSATDIDNFEEEVDGDMDIDSYKAEVPSKYKVKTKTIYDKIIANQPEFDNSTLEDFDVRNFKNTRGRVAAVISYGETYSESNTKDKVIEAFTYDDEGRITIKFKSIPGLELQAIAYVYSITGTLLIKTYQYNVSNSVTTNYVYDKNGRPVRIQDFDGSTSKDMVTYTYNDLGQMTKKSFWNTHTAGQSRSYDVDFDYNIRNWLKSINYDPGEVPVFNQVLYYGEALEDPNEYPAENRQYNGNIGLIHINQSSAQHPVIFSLYTYDQFNRLTKVKSGGTEKDDFFDAEYEYDQTGRIIKKNEGFVAGQPINKLENYTYQDNKNRLRFIPESSKKQSGGFDNYLYDLNGNMVLDRSKKMAIKYDWRDMPVMFKFYNTIPDADIAWWDAANLENGGYGTVNLMSYVEMMYDAGGNRVYKKVYNPNPPPENPK